MILGVIVSGVIEQVKIESVATLGILIDQPSADSWSVSVVLRGYHQSAQLSQRGVRVLHDDVGEDSAQDQDDQDDDVAWPAAGVD